ncbi:hypothetical protein CPB83DRAFT_900448 [Crepidotus variabilis]|uniref:Uncharacterized protein n=1 Tax=Crepidotus variabilis TaxID=179855 RepID=A0A9P6JI09_9AGAR|nr:hypothetical protein CPB83DRAFT_900448 [Crepidotus variabilis]
METTTRITRSSAKGTLPSSPELPKQPQPPSTKRKKAWVEEVDDEDEDEDDEDDEDEDEDEDDNDDDDDGDNDDSEATALPLKEAPLPPSAVRLNLDGRDKGFPELFLLESHSLIPKPIKRKARIILMVYDCRKSAMRKLFERSANSKPPAGEEEAEQKGFFLLRPSWDDRVVLRDKYGSGREQDDTIVSWATSKDEQSERIPDFRALQKAILGDPSKMTRSKPTNGPDGSLVGGVNFERHYRARSLKNGPRCYPLSTTVQVPKRTSAPGAQAKVFDITKDDDANMRFDLLKMGSTSAMAGMWKGGAQLHDTLKTQASFTNLPRVGTDSNVAHPAFQLNIAPAVEPSKSKSADIEALGKFGSAHVDGGDHPGCPTAMTILSPECAEVETEIFFVLDLGLGWFMEEFSTLFFSGLYYHGGCQPTYKARKRDRKNLYYRLTLIAYPPNDPLSGTDALAFASLPNKVVLPIGYELRNPASTHRLNGRVNCTQATYTSDGSAIFEPISSMRHFTGGFSELCVDLVRQMDPCLLVRVDIAKLISSFSYVVEGVRTQAPEWPLAPGWRGEDVRVGKSYDRLLKKKFNVSSIQELAKKYPKNLAKLWNTDDPGSSLPFGNPEYKAALDQWEAHAKRSRSKIPLYSVTDSENPFGGRLASRAKGIAQTARNNKAKSSGGKGGKPKKPKGKKTKKIDNSREEEERPNKRRRTGDDESPACANERMEVDQEAAEVESEDPLDEDPFGETSHAMNESRQTLGFLALLSVDNLSVYERSLQEAVCLMDDVTMLSPGRSVLASIRDQPIGRGSRDFVRQYSAHLSLLHERKSDVGLQTLILQVFLWDYLEHHIETSWPYVNGAVSARPSDGLGRLIADVASALATRPGKTILDASTYFPDFEGEECVHTISYQYKSYKLPTLCDVQQRVVRILCDWLGLPDPSRLYPRAWFVIEVVKTIGSEALRLGFVQHAANHVNIDVLDIGKNKQVDRAMITTWFEYNLVQHPASNPHILHLKTRPCLMGLMGP